jgi:hypothetical protein
MGQLFSTKKQELEYKAEQEKLKKQQEAKALKLQQEAETLRKQLEEVHAKHAQLQRQVNVVPYDMKVKPLEGWPDGFVQKDAEFKIPENTTILFARIWTQKVGNGKQCQWKYHVELLNDPDPERKWVPGKTKSDVVFEWHHWFQNYNNDWNAFPWIVHCDYEWKWMRYTLQTYIEEMIGPDTKASEDVCTKLIINKFMEKYVSGKLETK